MLDARRFQFEVLPRPLHIKPHRRYLKRVKNAASRTIETNGGYLQVWFVVAFIMLAGGVMYATVKSDNESAARIAAQAASADKLPYQKSPESAPESDLGSQIERAKECFPTYTNLEMKVYESLKGDSWVASSDQSTIVGLTSTKMSACAVQRKVLDYLSRYPRDQRSEALAAIVDAVQRR